MIIEKLQSRMLKWICGQELGGFYGRRNPPVKLRLASYEQEDGVMNRGCQYDESVVMTV